MRRTPAGDETMTVTHLSHFELKEIGKTDDTVVLEGTLASCRRMAFSHGCEVAGEETFKDSTRIARYRLKDAEGHAGSIHAGQDAWCLVLPRRIWDRPL